jgi:hypothetical protein
VKEVQQLIQRLRKDRAAGHGSLGQPAGLMEELARRQTGMEGLFKIGELALQGLDPGIFVDTVLDFTIQSLRGDAALLLLRDHEGNFTPSQKGDTALVSSLLSLLHNAFNELVATGKEALTLTTKEQPFTALAALIPGSARAWASSAWGGRAERRLPADERVPAGLCTDHRARAAADPAPERTSSRT